MRWIIVLVCILIIVLIVVLALGIRRPHKDKDAPPETTSTLAITENNSYDTPFPLSVKSLKQLAYEPPSTLSQTINTLANKSKEARQQGENVVFTNMHLQNMREPQNIIDENTIASRARRFIQQNVQPVLITVNPRPLSVQDYRRFHSSSSLIYGPALLWDSDFLINDYKAYVLGLNYNDIQLYVVPIRSLRDKQVEFIAVLPRLKRGKVTSNVDPSIIFSNFTNWMQSFIVQKVPVNSVLIFKGSDFSTNSVFYDDTPNPNLYPIEDLSEK